MKNKDIRELGPEELKAKEKDLRDEIFRLRMKRAASSLDNKMLIHNRRKDLARVVTHISMKREGKAK